MESTPRLYHTLVYVFSQHQNWVDLRHLKTLAWMIVGLIQSSHVDWIFREKWRKGLDNSGRRGNSPAMARESV